MLCNHWGLALKCLMATCNLSPSARVKDDAKVPFQLVYQKPAYYPNCGRLVITAIPTSHQRYKEANWMLTVSKGNLWGMAMICIHISLWG